MAAVVAVRISVMLVPRNVDWTDAGERQMTDECFGYLPRRLADTAVRVGTSVPRDTYCIGYKVYRPRPTVARSYRLALHRMRLDFGPLRRGRTNVQHVT